MWLLASFLVEEPPESIQSLRYGASSGFLSVPDPCGVRGAWTRLSCLQPGREPNDTRLVMQWHGAGVPSVDMEQPILLGSALRSIQMTNRELGRQSAACATARGTCRKCSRRTRSTIPWNTSGA